jgi:hypothetical protein
MIMMPPHEPMISPPGAINSNEEEKIEAIP